MLVASTSEDEHKQHLHTLCQRFNKYGVLLNTTKCIFDAKELTFLGYTVSAEGIRPLEEKVAELSRFQRPVLVKDLRRFFGMHNFYRRFKPHAARIHVPLQAALAGRKLKGSQQVDWTHTMVQAFVDCKASLSRAILLVHPDPSPPLTSFTDPSHTAIGAALQQRVSTLGNPWLSTPIRSAQQKYSRYDRELLGVFEAIKTSALSSKAVPLPSLHFTSFPLMLSSNAKIHANHSNSVIWNLLDNTLMTSGMSQGTTML